jgi:hypothetical protein
MQIVSQGGVDTALLELELCFVKPDQVLLMGLDDPEVDPLSDQVSAVAVRITNEAADAEQLAGMQRLADVLVGLDPALTVGIAEDGAEWGLLLFGGHRLPDFQVNPDHVLVFAPITEAHLQAPTADAFDAAFSADVLTLFAQDGWVAVHTGLGCIVKAQSFSFRDWVESDDASPQADCADSKPGTVAQTNSRTPLAPGEQKRAWWRLW